MSKSSYQSTAGDQFYWAQNQTARINSRSDNCHDVHYRCGYMGHG